MTLRIAGGGDAKIAGGADVGDQLIGMEKVRFGRDGGVDIPPQSQYVFHTVCFQAGQKSVYLLPARSHTGEVSHGGDVVLILNDSGNFPGGLVDLGAARAKGDADKVGLNVLQTIQCFVNAVHRAGLFWGEYLAGEYSFSCLK